MNSDEIHNWCSVHKIERTRYEITPQGVDVYGNVNIFDQLDHGFPFQFNEIHGHFNCANTKLQSLKNCPRIIHGSFNCIQNELISLQYTPKLITEYFVCHNNRIPPWEHRYLLFSEIQKEVFAGEPELNAFFRKYQNQKALIPEALKILKHWDSRNAS